MGGGEGVLWESGNCTYKFQLNPLPYIGIISLSMQTGRSGLRDWKNLFISYYIRGGDDSYRVQGLGRKYWAWQNWEKGHRALWGDNTAMFIWYHILFLADDRLRIIFMFSDDVVDPKIFKGMFWIPSELNEIEFLWCWLDLFLRNVSMICYNSYIVSLLKITSVK